MGQTKQGFIAVFCTANLNQKHSEKLKKAEASLPNQTNGPSNPILCLQLWPELWHLHLNANEKIKEGSNIYVTM